MSFSQDNGYVPVDILALIDFVRQGVNTQFGNNYTTDTFIGTNWYKYFYVLIQKMLENETKTAEIFLKLQEYITITNERIQRPSVSFPGLVEAFASHDYLASVKPPNNTDRGKVFICVDTDELASDYADKKLEICGLIKDFVAAGVVSQGDQIESITLSNGQAFDFKFYLPNRIDVLLRMTATISENNLLSVPDDVALRQKVFDNIAARYKLGYNFEPERYFNLSDALWAGEVKLEWSDDAGANWHETIYDADYRDIFTFGLEDIEIVVS